MEDVKAGKRPPESPDKIGPYILEAPGTFPELSRLYGNLTEIGCEYRGNKVIIPSISDLWSGEPIGIADYPVSIAAILVASPIWNGKYALHIGFSLSGPQEERKKAKEAINRAFGVQ